MNQRSPIAATLFAGAILSLSVDAHAQARTGSAQCESDNGGLTLPAGFCATVFADSVWGARHLIVAPNGDVIVSTYGRRSGGEGGSGGVGGGIVVLRDQNGDGHADRRSRFGDFRTSEVALHDGYLYTENSTDILRYPWKVGAMEPTGAAETMVKGLPKGGHAAKTFAVGPDGMLYVNIGSPTNSCQEQDRKKESPGKNPCAELETRAGIWRFSATRHDQTESDGVRFATGIRNAVAIAFEPHDGLWAAQNGRDQLYDNWPQHFTAAQSAESPAEELFHVEKGDDFGWPYCYFDTERHEKMLAPEYGGDGRKVGLCASKKGNVASYPGHWAPLGLLFYTGSQLPASYRNGVFIVFHGSWNRAPMPQAGFNVVFQPLANGRPAGSYQMFVKSFMETEKTLTHRPVGLAQGPDGSLYLSDDMGGRIWKITYVGAR